MKKLLSLIALLPLVVGGQPLSGPFPTQAGTVAYGLSGYKWIGCEPVSLELGQPQSFQLKASRDGTNWVTLQANTSFLDTSVIGGLFAPWIAHYGTNWLVAYDAFAVFNNSSAAAFGVWGLAYSPDLVNWTKVGYITNAVMNHAAVFGGNFYQENGVLYNYLPLSSGNAAGAVFVSTPADAFGTTWTTPVAVVTNPVTIRDSTVIQRNGTWFLFGCNDNGTQLICTMTNTTGPTNTFFMYSSNIFNFYGTFGSQSGGGLEAPEVRRLADGTYIMYCHANPGLVCKTVYSKSTDLITWTTPQEINENGIFGGRLTVWPLDYTGNAQVDSITESNLANVIYQNVYYLNTTAGTINATSGPRPFGGSSAGVIHYSVVANAVDNANGVFDVAEFEISQLFAADTPIGASQNAVGPVKVTKINRPTTAWNVSIITPNGANAQGNIAVGPRLKVTGPSDHNATRWYVREWWENVTYPVNTDNGGASIWSTTAPVNEGPPMNGSAITNLPYPILTNFTVYAAGTAYTLTGSSAALDFGTTDPVLTINQAGTYKISGKVGVKYVSATYAGAQTVTFKFRRTNNTAADLTSGSRAVELPVLTTFTGGDVIDLPDIIYTATSGDTVTIFGILSATPSAGSVTADSADLMAIRLY